MISWLYAGIVVVFVIAGYCAIREANRPGVTWDEHVKQFELAARDFVRRLLR